MSQFVSPLDQFDELKRSAVMTLFHQGRSSTLYCVSRGAKSYIYKEFLSRSRIDLIKRILFGSRAMRSMQAALKFQQLGFNIFNQIGVFQAPKLSRSSSSVLILEFDPSVISLRELFPQLVSIRERRSIILQLSREVARMHKIGHAHDDLNLGNVMFARGDSNQKLIYCDIDRVRSALFGSFRLRSRQVIKNLRQLSKIDVGLSEREKLLFLFSYLKNRGIQRREGRAFITFLKKTLF